MRDKIELIKQFLLGLWQIFKRVPKEKKILGGFIVLLAVLLLFQSLIANPLLRLKAMRFQFNSQKKLINFYKEFETGTGLLMKEAGEKEKDLGEIIKEAFVSDAQLPGYFDQLRGLVKSYNLELVTLDFMPQEKVLDANGRQLEYFKKLPLSFTVKGDYSNIMLLLYKLEEGRPIFDIAAVHIKQESPDFYDVSMEMKPSIYTISSGDR